jgi:hypothetical protein
MKTTVDLPEGLLREAQQAAHEDNTTLKDLLIAGLHTVLENRKRPRPYVLEDFSVTGNGLQPEFQGASWQKIRDAAYGYDEFT